MGLPAFAQHPLEIGGSLLVDQKLSRIGPAFFEDGGRLAPDQFGAASAKAAITAKRQLIRPAVQCAVAAFHGLDAKRIAGLQRPYANWTKDRGQVAAETHVQAESPALALEIFQGMKLEIARQGCSGRRES